MARRCRRGHSQGKHAEAEAAAKEGLKILGMQWLITDARGQ